MSEQLDNSAFRKKRLKDLLLRLHDGESQQSVQQELLASLSNIPYGEVVEVEQQLIQEGLPAEEILRLCDAHSAVLNGSIDVSAARKVPVGHPLDTFIHENKALLEVTQQAIKIIERLPSEAEGSLPGTILELTGLFNKLLDVDKHYKRKEYLAFPYLEKIGVTGPPKVMWGKHDEIRGLLKGSIEVLKTTDVSKDDFLAAAELLLSPALKGVFDMVGKEEQILFPMLMDSLTEADWWEIEKQSMEIGYCLYDPPTAWRPTGSSETPSAESPQHGDSIKLSTGFLTVEELQSLFSTLPVDVTFVDRDDKVRFYSQGKDRIFPRTRAIINRDVRHCHPPASAHIVEKILNDFKSGKQERAPFWINMGGRLIHIEYLALRNDKGEYLGTIEVTQDVTGHRQLEGEQRILSYK